MKEFQLDEKVRKKKAGLINALTEETASAAEAVREEKAGVKIARRKRKIAGFTLDPVVKDRLAAIAMVEDRNMSRIVEELVNRLFEQKWSEWSEDTKRFLLRKFPDIKP